MMQKAAFVRSSGCLRWLSRSARFACPCTITSGTNSRWEVGPSPPARGIAAICSPGTAAMASCLFKAHFTLDKAAPPIHRPLRTSSLVSLLRSILFSMSSVSSSRIETPNQSLQPTALWRCASVSILISVFSVGAQPRSQSSG